MRKRLLVSIVAVLALAAVASPAFGQSKSAKSTHRALRSNVRALTMKNPAKAHPTAPQANWTNLASMNTAVFENGGGAFTANRLFVPGGFTTTGGALFDQMQIFKVMGATWSTDADHLSNLTGLPGVADAAVCSDNTGKVHVINGTLDGSFIYTAHLVFDPLAPAGSKWSALAFPNTVADGNFYSQDSGCAFIGGKVILFGGYGLTDAQGAAQFERLTWSYDPATNTWSDTGKLMITGRIWQGYASNSTRAFAAGGSNNITTFAPIAKTETFTTAAGWKAMADLPAARLAPGMGLLGSTVAVFGGRNSSGQVLGTTVGCVAAACGPGPWNDLNKNLNTARWLTSWGSGGGRLFDAGGFNSAGTILSSAESTT
jgi:hypothetical protein